MPENKDEDCPNGTHCPTQTGDLVTRGFCDERFLRVSDKLDNISKKLDEITSEKKEKDHAYRNVLLSIVSGAVIAAIGWLLAKVPH